MNKVRLVLLILFLAGLFSFAYTGSIGADPLPTDSDGDGVPDDMDVCPYSPNDDSDGDGVCDAVDDAPTVPNSDQSDIDGDGVGDVVDICIGDDFSGDSDYDGVCNDVDNTPDGTDTDGDGYPDDMDVCPNDPLDDGDGDGVCGDIDNAPTVPNSDQSDIDGDGVGDVVDICIGDDFSGDSDYDGVCNDVDNTPDGADTDGDGYPDDMDVCPNDPLDDGDGDGVCGDIDNAPTVPNSDQSDIDGDGVGDVVDICIGDDSAGDSDGDGVCDDVDNAPTVPNSDQSDIDGDGVGDVVDICIGDDFSGDSDGDGVCGDIDVFPNDASESADGDGDGVGDNADVFPNNATESVDSDGDGVGDNGDVAPNDFNPDQADVDGDGTADVVDVCPNDSSNTCDQDGSASTYIAAEDGGSLATSDGSVSISMPPGAATASGSVSITDSDDGSSGFELTSSKGKVLGLYSVDLQPSQTFDAPVAITFAWDDIDDNGVVDGTNAKEANLIITKDNAVLTDKCRNEPVGDGSLPDCDTDANTFTFEVTSWSEFALAFTSDPVIASVSAPLDPVRVFNETFTISADFTDADDDDSHSVMWNWGDGTPSQGGIVNQTNNAASGSHTYEKPGIYTVSLSLSDAYPNTAVAIYQQYVVVYDPNGGFVTGGGWIDSPEGAYKPGDVAYKDVTGKASFGFVAKYKKGANVPDGNTQFQFKAGDLKFHSSSYEWLVVAGNMAQFKGEGTVNGEEGYTFMLSADDDSPDTFRIQIWGDTGTVYDNGSQQALGGGSVKVHTRSK